MIEPFLLSSSLLAVMAQRLVRLLCRDCREAVIAGPAERDQLVSPPVRPRPPSTRPWVAPVAITAAIAAARVSTR